MPVYHHLRWVYAGGDENGDGGGGDEEVDEREEKEEEDGEDEGEGKGEGDGEDNTPRAQPRSRRQRRRLLSAKDERRAELRAYLREKDRFEEYRRDRGKNKGRAAGRGGGGGAHRRRFNPDERKRGESEGGPPPDGVGAERSRKIKPRPPPPQMGRYDVGLTYLNVPKAASTAIQIAFKDVVRRGRSDASSHIEDTRRSLIDGLAPGGRGSGAAPDVRTALPWESGAGGGRGSAGGEARYRVRNAVEGGCCHRLDPRAPRTEGGSRDETRALEGEGNETHHRLRKSERYLTEILALNRPHPHHVVFTVIRDPISRFVSGVAQLLGMERAARRPGRDLQKQCLRNAASAIATEGDNTTSAAATRTAENVKDRVSSLRRAVLRCAVSRLREDESEYGLDVDVHLTPAATRLASYVLPLSPDAVDAVVAVYPMEEVDGLLDALGYSAAGGEKKRERKGDKVLSGGKRKKTLPKWQRRRLTTTNDADANVDGGAKNKVGTREYKAQVKWTHLSPDMREALGGLSVRDMDGDMIAEVCRLYAVDVALVRYLGFGAPLCDGLVAG